MRLIMSELQNEVDYLHLALDQVEKEYAERYPHLPIDRILYVSDLLLSFLFSTLAKEDMLDKNTLYAIDATRRVVEILRDVGMGGIRH